MQSNESQRVTFTPQATTPAQQAPQSSFSAADEDHGGFAERHMDACAAYKIHELDRPGTSFDDIKIAHIGTRVRF